jgi:hypothetical protein
LEINFNISLKTSKLAAKGIPLLALFAVLIFVTYYTLEVTYARATGTLELSSLQNLTSQPEKKIEQVYECNNNNNNNTTCAAQLQSIPFVLPFP